MSAEKQATIDVRNAIFEIADGKPFGSIMQGIVMAQAKLAAATCGGDPAQTAEQLRFYNKIMMEAVPIYCAEIEMGHPNPPKN